MQHVNAQAAQNSLPQHKMKEESKNGYVKVKESAFLQYCRINDLSVSHSQVWNLRNPDIKMTPILNHSSSGHASSDREALFNNSRFSFDQEDSADSVKKMCEVLRKR